ncbi:MAG: motility protein A [Peptostreptococcaceae bacterium]
MKKNDILTPLGMILAIGFILLGISSGDVGIEGFYDFSSILITVGGSFAAVLITFSIDEMKLLLKMTSTLFKNNSISKIDLIDTLKELSMKSRKQGMLAIESDVLNIEDDFLKSGLELVIDGYEANSIIEILQVNIMESERRYNKASRVYKVWGSYAPAFGMLGTLIGLIQMLAQLDDPSTIASGMAKALITTFYGSLLANALLNPLGFNLQTKGQKEAEYKEMMLVGILSIKNSESTRILEEKLISFLSIEEKYKYLDNSQDQSERVGLNAS